jgi:acetoin utilization protein AcuB
MRIRAEDGEVFAGPVDMNPTPIASDARPRTPNAADVHLRVHMTLGPHSVGVDQPLSVAHRIMREHGIRHLPVLRGGRLVGIVTQRDLYLVETLREVDASSVRVEEAMTDDAYVVAPSEPLESVARTMAEKKYGCAVVMEGSEVVGIFTAVDALRALANLLAARAT